MLKFPTCLFMYMYVYIITFLDSQVISLKTSCLAHLAKQTSQEKVLYSIMLGLKMNKQEF
jgi:hypothetical protein